MGDRCTEYTFLATFATSGTSCDAVDPVPRTATRASSQVDGVIPARGVHQRPGERLLLDEIRKHRLGEQTDRRDHDVEGVLLAGRRWSAAMSSMSASHRAETISVFSFRFGPSR